MSNLSTRDTDYATGKKRPLPEFTPSDFSVGLTDFKKRFKPSLDNRVVTMPFIRRKITKAYRRYSTKYAKKPKKKMVLRPKWTVVNPNFECIKLKYIWFGRCDYIDSAVGVPATDKIIGQTEINLSCFKGPIKQIWAENSDLSMSTTGVKPATENRKYVSIQTASNPNPASSIAIKDMFSRGRVKGVKFKISLCNNEPDKICDFILYPSGKRLTGDQNNLRSPLVWAKMASEKWAWSKTCTGPAGSQNIVFYKGYYDLARAHGVTKEAYRSCQDYGFDVSTEDASDDPQNSSWLYLFMRTTTQEGELTGTDVKLNIELDYYYEFYEKNPISI